ncbi:MAG: c-type cytochrome biogenesis protein CcmI [Rubrivivax sp.]|nr:MAG: c-type cytochrome biogenesis protein CcmI [Rubrivivax sp.]
MTAFFTSTAMMLVMALLFVLPVLLRRADPSSSDDPVNGTSSGALNLEVLRDQRRELDADLQAGTLDASAHQSSRQDLERRVAQEVIAGSQAAAPTPPQPVVAAGLATAILSAAAVLYAAVGTPGALDPAARRPVMAADEAGGVARAAEGEQGAGAVDAVTPEQIESMVARLAARLKSTPDDAAGWRMLARSYETLRRFDQAAVAYANLVRIGPETPELLADYAVVLGMSQGQTLSGEPETLIHRALALEPDNIQALALAGSAAYERHDYAQAVVPWRRLLALVPADSDMARSIAANVAKAEALARQNRSAVAPS